MRSDRRKWDNIFQLLICIQLWTQLHAGRTPMFLKSKLKGFILPGSLFPFQIDIFSLNISTNLSIQEKVNFPDSLTMVFIFCTKNSLDPHLGNFKIWLQIFCTFCTNCEKSMSLIEMPRIAINLSFFTIHPLSVATIILGKVD